MGFIDTIIDQKRAELAARMSVRSIATIERAAASTPVRDFHAAVTGGDRVIAELKARTPSVASFRQSGSLRRLARAYAEGGAAAISIVTDERNFGTSLADVGRVREQVNLPVLVKDFMFDPYQVVEARAHGADAVLLIARLLDWDRLTGLLDLTHRLGMSALVETHDENEMMTALAARARIVGINNRDLDTMKTSLDTTRRLARLVPAGVVLVAESGITSRADVESLAACGAGAFLVGRSLLDADDPGAKLRELRGA